MAIYEFEGRRPLVAAGAYVHPSADVIGDVRVGADCWVGPGARLRGDYGTVVIGACTAVEENVVVHARPGQTCVVGEWVTLGHAAVVHTATIAPYAVIGMGAIVSDWVVVGEWAVVAEGAVLSQRMEVPPGRIAVGVPARLLEKPVGDDYRTAWTTFKQTYVDLARRYHDGLVAVDEPDDAKGRSAP